jgi:photosystem II stability/assembly factor-like uncharacterized protein
MRGQIGLSFHIRRGLLTFVFVLCFVLMGQNVLFGVPNNTVWSVLKIGAGGFVTGIDIAGDGTKVVKTDTYGAWYYNNSAGLWQQCVTTHSMPDRVKGVLQNRGVYEIAIAPSNTKRFYMFYNGYVLRSDNHCSTWALTNFPRDSADFVKGHPENDRYRTYGRKMAVDPANQNVVYVGTPSQGIFVTTDGGDSWTSISRSSIANSASVSGVYPGHAIAFDPNSRVSGGVTQGIYIASYGTGVYSSTNGGITWTLTRSTPTTFQHMIVDQNGNVWLCDDFKGGHLHKYTGGRWASIPRAGNECHSIAVNPSNANSVYVGTNSGKLLLSTDGGDSWVGPNRGRISSSDIPWLAWANDGWLANGDMKFDPSRSNLLYFAEGTGVFYTNPPTKKATVNWISQSAAIEQLVANWIISPPGGNPIVASWDRPVFTISDPNSYQAKYGINNVNEIQHGASCDWASLSPSMIVCIADTSRADTSGFSRNGGSTWSTFSALPSEIGRKYYGGSIAASTSTHFIWVPSHCGNPFYTTNGGISWTKIVISGVPENDCGWHRAYYLTRQIVIADRVNGNTFYMYNDGSATAGAAGIWKSSNGGETWLQVKSGGFDWRGASNYNAQMRSVPGQAGNFYFTSGWKSGVQPVNQSFWECIDNGTVTSCDRIANVKEVFSFGFGKAAPGKTYPTVFIYGWVNNVLGIWRSDDHCVTWTQISDGFPTGSFNRVNVIDGDNNTYGKVYVGFAGSGYAYGTLH